MFLKLFFLIHYLGKLPSLHTKFSWNWTHFESIRLPVSNFNNVPSQMWLWTVYSTFEITSESSAEYKMKFNIVSKSFLGLTSCYLTLDLSVVFIGCPRLSMLWASSCIPVFVQAVPSTCRIIHWTVLRPGLLFPQWKQSDVPFWQYWILEYTTNLENFKMMIFFFSLPL